MDDKAVICPYCGMSTGVVQDESYSGLSIAAVIFAVFSPLIGLILGIIVISNGNAKSKSLGKAAIIVSVAIMVVYVVVYLIFGAYLMALVQSLLQSVSH